MCIACHFQPECWATQAGIATPMPDHLLNPSSVYERALGESRVDAPADASTTYSLEPGDSFEGFIASGDADWIEVSLAANTTYEFAVSGHGEGPLPDPQIEVLGQSNDDFSSTTTAAGLVITTTQAVTTYIAVSASTDEAGGYELGVQEDPSPNIFDAMEIDRFSRLDGYLSAGDRDYYVVDNYFVGSSHSITLSPRGDDAGLQAPQIYIYQGAGNLIASNIAALNTDDAEDDYVVNFDVTSSTPVTIEISGGSPDNTGLYELRSMSNPLGNIDTNWFILPNYYYTQSFGTNDSDWRYIDLEAGKTYGVYMYRFRDSGVDPVLTVMDQNGNIIGENDNHTDDPEDSVNAYVEITATYSGRHYIANDNAEGASPGLYGITVQDLTDANPIDAITWRDAAVPSDDPITVFFAEDGQVVNGDGALIESDGFSRDIRQDIMAIFRQISTFADVEFVQTRDQATADFRIARFDFDSIGESFLGQAIPQGETFYSDGLILLDDDHWTDAALGRGGFMNHVIAHEIGHAMGLAHTHDYGGASLPFLNVRGSTDLGISDLNQVPYSAMSYNDYWAGGLGTVPEDLGQGHLWGFGSFDITALQQVYGATESYRATNSDYLIGRNSWLEAIWDTGGTDRIRYNGREDSTIDLRAATNDYTETGGGGISFIPGGYSGFVMSAGVQIENALGGAGADQLIGNDLDNKLDGRNGADTALGGRGNDLILGGLGGDRLEGNAGNDVIQGGRGHDTVYGNRGSDTLYGNGNNDILDGGGNGDTLFGGQHNDILIGGNGDDRLDGGTGRDVFKFDLSDGNDVIVEFTEEDWIDLSATGLSFADISITASGSETVVRFGSTIIRIETLAADLDASDFIF